MNSDKSLTGWAEIGQQLKNWSKPSLLALVKDLYGLSAGNRDFLLARFQAESAGGAALEQYRRKIIEQFFPKRGYGKLKLAQARKAIRDYRKATGNLQGTIDLLLSYVENGTKFTNEFGDINESFYNSLESALNELVKLLLQAGAGGYPRFRDRILRVEQMAQHIGWGYGDSVREQVGRLEEALAGKSFS